MLTTETRPAPLPARPAAPAAAQPAGRRPLPAGAVRWSRTYLDAKGLPQAADHDVPVDANDRRTEHVRHTCRGHIEIDGVKQQCDHVAWLAPDEPGRYCPDHGCQLTSEQGTRNPMLPLAAMWHTLEPAARAAYLLPVEVAAGVAIQAAHVPTWTVLAATPAVVAGSHAAIRTYLTRRALRRDRIEEDQDDGRRIRTIARRARYATYCAATGCTWLTLAAATSPHTWPGRAVWATLPVAWAVAAAPWWRYQAAFRDRPEPVEQTAVAEQPNHLEAGALEAATTWRDEVNLPGTHLDMATWQPTVCGWQAVIVATKRGALNQLGGDNMKATIRRIASAYDVPKSAITWIEEHDDSPNRALLLIQPNNPLKEGQLWAGPESIRIEKNRIVAEVGRLIDGTAMDEVLFKFGHGAPGGLTLGTTGSGKSERLRGRLVIERWTSYVDPVTQTRRGLFLSFLHDPKRLEAFAEFRNAIHGYGTTRDDAHIMLDAFLREMIRRFDFLATLKWTDSKNRPRVGSIKWNPIVHGPLLGAVFDEFHELAGDAELTKKLEKLARYIRACGMRVEIASHMGTLGDTGSQALRDMVAGGRASLLRTTSGLNAGLVTGGQLVGDPRTLPRSPGMCLVVDGETPTVMGRYAFIPDDEEAERLGSRSVYDWLFDDDNQPIGYPAEIPPETAEAFGPEFMQWMDAGRSERGREAGAFKSSASAQPTADDLSAADALRRLLFAAGKPLARKVIAEHPLWEPRSVTSTLTKALRDGQDATPPWLVKTADGKFELTASAREECAARQAEGEQ